MPQARVTPRADETGGSEGASTKAVDDATRRAVGAAYRVVDRYIEAGRAESSQRGSWFEPPAHIPKSSPRDVEHRGPSATDSRLVSMIADAVAQRVPEAVQGGLSSAPETAARSTMELLGSVLQNLAGDQLQKTDIAPKLAGAAGELLQTVLTAGIQQLSENLAPKSASATEPTSDEQDSDWQDYFTSVPGRAYEEDTGNTGHEHRLPSGWVDLDTCEQLTHRLRDTPPSDDYTAVSEFDPADTAEPRAASGKGSD